MVVFTCDGHLDMKVNNKLNEPTMTMSSILYLPLTLTIIMLTQFLRLINIHIFIYFLHSLYFQGYSYFKVISLKGAILQSCKRDILLLW